jgi:hypothetical protein
MTVLAIEVEVNGKRLVVAGAKDLALLEPVMNFKGDNLYF